MQNQIPAGSDVNRKGRHGYWYDGERIDRQARERAEARERQSIAEMDAMPARFGLCYFIGNLEQGLVKIGYSKNVPGRRNRLSGSIPFPIRVLATATGGMDREAHYHHKFKGADIGGEWFTITPAILAEIARLNATRPADLGRGM
ncbi:GIY-YIG nuclease family protein [Sphingobium yanoikuyae]|uniref:GIY-YIG nuclease family protein n=1 Tax=Sphingobium yanoikuyae TaxID=13690 RepID=UPI003B9211C4